MSHLLHHVKEEEPHWARGDVSNQAQATCSEWCLAPSTQMKVNLYDTDGALLPFQ